MTNEEISLNTKRSLAKSLKKLMTKKPFKKITVSEIIQDCNVNRKTFYYHFKDIYDLLTWIFEQEAIDVVKHFDLLVDFEDALIFIMNYVENNSDIINCVYDSFGRDELKRFFYADFFDVIVSIIELEEKSTGKKLTADYKNYLSDFYTEALAGGLINWCKSKERRDRDVMIKYIHTTIHQSLIAILQNVGTDICQ